jgi:hypothetical protein
MSFAEEILDAAVQELKDEAVELIPVAISAIKGLLQGQPPERVISRAERDALANYAQKRLDQALERGKGG